MRPASRSLTIAAQTSASSSVQPWPRGRPVQHVAVDVIGAQVLERAGHRLGDLRGEVGVRVVGQPVVLAALVGELRLEEEIRARDHARAVGGGEPLTDAGLEVVPPLVGGVDAPEARPERELGERRGAVFLPGGAVEEIGNARASRLGIGPFCHGPMALESATSARAMRANDADAASATFPTCTRVSVLRYLTRPCGQSAPRGRGRRPVP